MKRRSILGVAGAIVVAGAIGTGAALAGGANDTDMPITGEALDEASSAAIAHLGGGRVTDTEVGDEESLYEVEVTLDDGRQIDVQLDEAFNVVGTEDDGVGDSEDDHDD